MEDNKKNSHKDQEKAKTLSLQAVFGDDWKKQSAGIFPQYRPFRDYVVKAANVARSKSTIGAKFTIIDRDNDLRLSNNYLSVHILTKAVNGKPVKYDENTYQNLSESGFELSPIEIISVKANGKQISFHMIDGEAVFEADKSAQIEVNGDSDLALSVIQFASSEILYKGKPYPVKKQKVAIPSFDGGNVCDVHYPFIEYILTKDDNDQREGEITIELEDDPSLNLSVYDVFFEEGVNQVYFEGDGNSSNEHEYFKYAYANRETGRITLKLENRTIDPSKKVHVRANDAQLKRQKKAIEAITNRPNIYQLPLLKLAASRKFDPQPLGNFSPSYVPLKYKVLTDASRKGTDEQRDFVHKALQTPDFMILQGPPGSGKTTAILELIFQLCLKGKKVLLCASTHVAIDNVLEKIVTHPKSEELLEAINPIRVGNEENVYSDCVKPYLYKNQIEGHKDYAKIMEENYNLVCGTTIGVLQFPPIKAAVEDADNVSIEPLFDVMIIDEASKTTFSEFLVPAVLCKRWVIVGDVKQLTPYIDESDLVPTLLECPPLKDPNDRLGLNMLLTLQDQKSERYINRAFVLPRSAIEYVDTRFGQNCSLPIVALTNGDVVNFTLVTDQDLHEGSYKLAALSATSAVFLIDEELAEEALPFLPQNVELFHHAFNVSNPSHFGAYQILRHRGSFGKNYTDDFERWNKKIENEILWRLKRLNELDADQKSAKNYNEQIEKYRSLLSDEKVIKDGTDKNNEQKFISERDQFDRSLDVLRSIAIPSVITILQEGINKNNFYQTILTSGLNEYEKSSRFVKLQYQHRMHPDISAIPRKYVYEGGALLDSSAWKSKMDYPSPNEKRFEVRHVNPSADTKNNRNENEADALIKELTNFLSYAEKNPKKDGSKYQIAVLSFYLGQVVYLRNELRKLFGQKANYNFHKDNVDVVLNTVDKFQGQEADIVYLSTVKRKTDKSLGFLDSKNRINVALTRAKEKLILFCDKGIAQGRGDELLAKVINEVK